ncbi:MAG: hypothetical protein RLZZ290_56 [Pseudomonadota bacterium]
MLSTMPRLSANLSFLWPDLPVLERFAAARRAGFDAVELLFPYDQSLAVLSELLDGHGLQMVLINAPAGDWSRGDRGFAAQPGQEAAFRLSIHQALEVADALDVGCIHVMSGHMKSGGEALSESQEQVLMRNLQWAGDQARAAGRRISIEPLNAVDMPGYFLSHIDQALRILDDLNHPSVGLQFDFYHQQRSRGEIMLSLDRARSRLFHVQIAGAPDRREPDRGELNHLRVLGHLDQIGYSGFVGCEYRPSQDTDSGLAWAKPYLQGVT